jgi:O-antigen/teichoic acid export membrane protein
MLKYLLGIDAVGIYDSAVRLSEVWYFVPALIISTVFPAIVNARMTSKTSYENRLVYLYSLMIGLGILVALPISVLSGWIMTTLYGAAFAGGSSTLALYIWAGVPVFFMMAVNNYLLAENHTKIMFVSSFAGMIANVILNLIFIPRLGLEGAALATLCSYILIPVSVFLFSKKMREHSKLVYKAIVLPFSLIS